MPSVKPTRAGRLAEDFGGDARDWYAAICNLVDYHSDIGGISEGEAAIQMRQWADDARRGYGILKEDDDFLRIAPLTLHYAGVRLWVELTVLGYQKRKRG